MQDPSFGSWSFTIIRANGLHFLRPEKSWRPIITVHADDDSGAEHELVLGSDGQNPNLKHAFVLHGVGSTTKLEIKVWHKSQSKRKGKKRNLVSVVCVSLEDILRRQGTGAVSEIRFSVCTTASKKTPTKPQNGACLAVKLRPPVAAPSPPPPYAEDAESDSGSSASTHPPSPSTDDDVNHVAEVENSALRRRRRAGYAIWSDEDECAHAHIEYSDGELDAESICMHTSECQDEKPPSDEEEELQLGLLRPGVSRAGTERVWVVSASLLPTYVDQLSVASSVSVAEYVLDAVSPYQHFKDARVDSDWEAILHRFQTEWYFIGGSLVSLAALFAAVFGFASGTMFPVDGLAQRAVAFGGVSAGVGIGVDSWFIFSYSGADAMKFQRKARDVFSSYFFFCLSARVPALCMLASALALMLFLFVVTYAVWPGAVLAVCFVAGIVLSLQFIVYGVRGCVRGGRRCVRWVTRRKTTTTIPAPTASQTVAQEATAS